MANNTINTRIILKNDSTANWTSKDPVLLKGEVGFDLDLGIFKVGDGIKKWSEITVTYSNLQDILSTIDQKIQDAVGDLHQTQIFEADVANGGDKIAAITAVVGETTLYKGDIAIAKEAISGDKKEYTAYVYNGTAWAAMDGNYSASNVYFDKDFIATYQFGKYKPDATGSVTIPADGKSMLNLLMESYAEEQEPTVTQPSVSISLTGSGAKEVGTEFTPAYSVSFNKGKYSFGPTDTGVTATYAVSDTNGGTATTATGSFTKFTVDETTNYKVNVTATYTDGVNPKSNIGTEVPSKKIVAGSKTAASGAVTGYRGWFYGYYNGTQAINDPTAITSAAVRAFGVRNGNFPTSVSTTKMQQMFFAAPAGKVSAVKVANAVNGAPQTVTGPVTIQVEGNNGFAAAAYDLFYVSNATAEGGDSTFTITTTKA